METGAVIRIWSAKSDFDLIRKGDKTKSFGHSFIFLNYIYEDGKIVRMQIADQGTRWSREYGIDSSAFGYWVGANLK